MNKSVTNRVDSNAILSHSKTIILIGTTDFFLLYIYYLNKTNASSIPHFFKTKCLIFIIQNLTQMNH